MLGLVLCLLDCGPLDSGQLVCDALSSKHEAKPVGRVCNQSSVVPMKS